MKAPYGATEVEYVNLFVHSGTREAMAEVIGIMAHCRVELEVNGKSIKAKIGLPESANNPGPNVWWKIPFGYPVKSGDTITVHLIGGDDVTIKHGFTITASIAIRGQIEIDGPR